MAWLHMQTRSEGAHIIMGMDMLLPQYDPEGVAGPAAKGPYPVLFLLHPQGSGCDSWLIKTMLEERARALPLAVMMPSCFNAFWVNMHRGREYADMLIKELPQVCSSYYDISTDPQMRFIAGAGMGGYGAVRAALLSDKFAFAASFLGDLDVKRLYRDGFAIDPRDIFGPEESFDKGPCDVYSALDAPVSRPSMRLYCPRESALFEENERFYSLAKERGFDVCLDTKNRAEGWAYYDACLGDLLARLPLGTEAE